MKEFTNQLDIVIPIFDEENNLLELSRRLTETCSQLKNIGWRVIFVNDGSTDHSLQIMHDLNKKDPHFTVIDLSRNFGHQAAISAGMAAATGDLTVLMDGDLQDPPEVIPDLVNCWRNGGQVVFAKRKSRKEKGIRRIGFSLFYIIQKWLSDFPMPSNTGIFCALDRIALMELNLFVEKNRFIPGLRSWIGFNQQEVVYNRDSRAKGEPKQTISNLIKYAVDGILSFSYKPLRLMTLWGLSVSILGFLLGCYFIGKRLLGIEIAQTGFTTLVTLILFLGGIQIMAVGLLGEYIGRIFDEVKRRPLYIVNKGLGIDPIPSSRTMVYQKNVDIGHK